MTVLAMAETLSRGGWVAVREALLSGFRASRVTFRMLSAGLVAGCLVEAGFAVAEEARAAVIVAVAEGGARLVAPGSEVVVDLFLELEPGEQVSGVRLEMEVSNLRDVSYRQVPDLMLGALPNAPWEDVSLIGDRRGSLPGEGRATARHRAIWNPVDAGIIGKLQAVGLTGEANQVPLGGFQGVAAVPGEVTIRFLELGNQTRCQGPKGSNCEIWAAGRGVLGTGVVVGDGLLASSGLLATSGLPQVAQAPPARAADVAAGPPKLAAPPRSPRAAPVPRPPGVQVAQRATVREDSQCLVEREQAQLGLAEAERDLAQVRLQGANLKVELEKSQLALEQLRAQGERTRADLSSASSRIDALEIALAAARSELADDDGDGVWNESDGCADTAKATGVDLSGCSAAQFCKRYAVRQDEGRAACWNADFENDEPLGNPGDCKVNSNSCVPR